MEINDVIVGAVVKDTVTGFTGVVMCKSEWLNGCNRLALQATKLKDGRPTDLVHIDVAQCQLVSQPKTKHQPQLGGPTITPQRQANPIR